MIGREIFAPALGCWQIAQKAQGYCLLKPHGLDYKFTRLRDLRLQGGMIGRAKQICIRASV